MSGEVVIPSWAAGAVAAGLGLVCLYIRWSLRSLHDLAQTRLTRLEDAVYDLDRRMIRIETILSGGTPGSNPAAPHVRVLTPPIGVPTDPQP